jgi:PST family polysaccharide transporter
VADLSHFSTNLLGFSVVAYWLRNADNLLVGKYFGSSALGIYARAYNLMLLPLSQVTWGVSKVMYPALSKVRGEKVRVKSLCLRTVRMVALITFPLMLGLLAVTDHFILALYGSDWAAVIPVLRILCLLGMLQSVSTMAGVILQSQGRTDWLFWWACVSGGLSIAGIIAGVLLGTLEAIAGCLLVSAIALLPLNIKIPGKLIDITWRDIWWDLWSVLACAVGMASTVWILGITLPHDWPHWRYLAIQIPFAIGVYALFVHLFRIASYEDLRRIVFRQIREALGPAVS